MRTLTLSVHEFIALMGGLDEQMEKSGFKAESGIYDAWYQQWRDIEAKVEKLSMMERADMYFDGKVNISDLSDAHLIEVKEQVQRQIDECQKLISDGDVDADPDDLEIWNQLMAVVFKL